MSESGNKSASPKAESTPDSNRFKLSDKLIFLIPLLIPLSYFRLTLSLNFWSGSFVLLATIVLNAVLACYVSRQAFHKKRPWHHPWIYSAIFIVFLGSMSNLSQWGKDYRFQRDKPFFLEYINALSPNTTESLSYLELPDELRKKVFYINGYKNEDETYITFVTQTAGYAGGKGCIYFTGTEEKLKEMASHSGYRFNHIEENWYYYFRS